MVYKAKVLTVNNFKLYYTKENLNLDFTTTPNHFEIDIIK